MTFPVLAKDWRALSVKYSELAKAIARVDYEGTSENTRIFRTIAFKQLWLLNHRVLVACTLLVISQGGDSCCHRGCLLYEELHVHSKVPKRRWWRCVYIRDQSYIHGYSQLRRCRVLRLRSSNHWSSRCGSVRSVEMRHGECVVGSNNERVLFVAREHVIKFFDISLVES